MIKIMKNLFMLFNFYVQIRLFIYEKLWKKIIIKKKKKKTQLFSYVHYKNK